VSTKKNADAVIPEILWAEWTSNAAHAQMIMRIYED
jgi:hypothetical protein